MEPTVKYELGQCCSTYHSTYANLELHGMREEIPIANATPSQMWIKGSKETWLNLQYSFVSNSQYKGTKLCHTGMVQLVCHWGWVWEWCGAALKVQSGMKKSLLGHLNGTIINALNHVMGVLALHSAPNALWNRCGIRKSVPNEFPSA